jgi:hypothetical protein
MYSRDRRDATKEVAAHLSRNPVAVALDQPLLVVPPRELARGLGPADCLREQMCMPRLAYGGRNSPLTPGSSNDAGVSLSALCRASGLPATPAAPT